MLIFDLLEKQSLKMQFDLKVRNPDLGLRLFPRLVIRDEEEIVFFIMHDAGGSSTEPDDMCLWTNCASLVQTFSGVFQDLWRNSTDTKKRIAEIETNKPTPKTFVISDPGEAATRFSETISAADKEIITLTSPEGLRDAWKDIAQLKEKAARGAITPVIAAAIHEGNALFVVLNSDRLIWAK